MNSLSIYRLMNNQKFKLKIIAIYLLIINSNLVYRYHQIYSILRVKEINHQ